ncbi:tetratricopeptide repeat protein [Paractinoplanes lichenicola]|uniref:Tetratricopeptide repeat protein n=1 Tax=Paractinoplanes lichenicola TaxID=2802976 RepID=A0ABS1VSV9_9ACTN|nr:tetratricopeptide repeat protein [Actinoplanes lichenicola]MBL7257554.1 tetratricopeptide repeat protein [Actinoplanes lichenicola]
MDQLAGDDAAGLFERASARDFAGREAEAEPLYRAALAAGLDDDLRPQAVIQLASTLRNLGRADEAVALLTEADGMEAYEDERLAFLALALIDAGNERRAAALAVRALAAHVPHYGRALTAYADQKASS